ncbi:unnamed protein product [Owenia fusiformis]|uniref:Structural maintenance of chromosomes protein n=1 Tax=Owenia fusiformis TaxID=6347 RepID=A0A8J1XYX3_OWEFU|nr:unnamed protein product [Owenia fusiformis]
MYIKSIIIDGFKSYAQRTEVNGFDPMFNAITGLNGSGKSNILDSICFLLGISNLSQVRASNLQELVYKSGQAGVTKATVSITFDNMDKKQSPLGYEQYEEITVTRQVVIGGRNKYLINGSNANNNRVQDLFRSVQLNINNPHFLIMQGRITKVLNMKPPEILSMIEEAAGTRLYESKKEAAQKTIEKKDTKLREIDTILKEEISPTLTKLQAERSSYLEYQKVIRELEHLNKLYIAYQFVCAEETCKRSADDLKKMQETVDKLNGTMQQVKDKLNQLDKDIAELEKKRDQEAGGVMEQIEADLNEKKKAHTKSQSAVDLKKENLKTEQKKHKSLTKQCQDDKAAMKTKEKEVDKIVSGYEKLQETSEADKKAHEAAQKHFHAVSAGLSSNADGEDASLNDQLLAARNEISNCSTETKQATMRLKHHQQEIKKKQADLKKTDQAYKKDKATLDAVKKNSQKLEAEMSKLGYEDGKEENLTSTRRGLLHDVQELQEKIDGIEARFPQLQFEYRDPEKNFDRSKVYGLVANLIKVKDPKYATALEVAAGGKLYNVVVDSEVTGKKLLQNGGLKRRYTFIPLNKISSRPIPDNVARKAESLVGKNDVHTALSLVEYKPELRSAMEYVFGNALICKDMNSAKKVAYDKDVMKKCVTLEGDSFDPAGTLTGGARPKTGSILAKLGDVKEARESLNEKKQAFQKVEKELDGLKKVAERFREVKQQFDLKAHEVELLEERLRQGTHHQQMEEVNEMQKTIDEDQKTVAEAEGRQKRANDKAKELEEKVNNAKAVRERELKTAEDAVTKAKKKMQESNKKSKEKQQEADSIRLEVEEMKKEVAGYEEQLLAVEEAIKGLEEQLVQVKEAAAESQAEVKEAERILKQKKDELNARNKEIAERVNQKHVLGQEAQEAELEKQELEHKITKSNKDAKDAANQVDHLIQKYDWIADEKKYFGQTNTAYDFNATDPKEAGKRIQKLQDTKDKLSKSVNMRAMNMLGKAEEQYNDLMKKRKIVLNDKKKIESVIAELDEKKNEALKQAYEQVNKDFGSIFSTLLPGTSAKLAPQDGASVLDGLEVKVAFGDVWKDSLSELSGGQRSLVALSLILAMLLFKPAPLYILDEVDAALDLSHTQNIGQMLRTHFKHSQFIVVSLKDGMFNNANVLFKTKFVDGVSTVSRYTQNISSKGAATSEVSKENKGKNKNKNGTAAKKSRLEAIPFASTSGQ